MIVLIPAYEPGPRLVALIADLRAAEPDAHILIVDDGSGPAYDDVFGAAACNATVLRHATNRGKGFALREGFHHAAAHHPGEAIVTADCDGQHTVGDILRVARAMTGAAGGTSGNGMVLGTRRFTGRVPARSRIGNGVTRALFRLATSRDVRDTQTGLRGYPAASVPWLLEVGGDRFEYEFRVLLEACRAGRPITQVDIETVYLDDNASSHFRAVADSLRVSAPLLLFGLSSLLAFTVDTVALLVLSAWTGSLLAAVIGARAASASINYTVNRLVVFEHGRRTSLGRSASQYLALAAILLAANYGVLDALTGMGVPLLAAKIGTEAALFAVSFGLQRSIVFAAPNDGRGGATAAREPDATAVASERELARG